MATGIARDTPRKLSTTTYFEASADQPWGSPTAGAGAPSEPNPQQAKHRRDVVAKLLPAVKALTAQVHAVLLEGGLAGEEYVQLHSLQVWLGQLISEYESAPGTQAQTKKR